jgi:putative ABC transport system substrate-binding protein
MSICLRRRDFIAGLGGAAAVWPLAARAQQAAMPVIAVLRLGGPSGPNPPNTAAFRQGLAEAGYVPGRNVALYGRSVTSASDLPGAAAELVDRRPAVIVTAGSAHAAVAAKAITSTIPIVFFMIDDPVKFGLVASYSRPGSNATGVNFRRNELSGKRLNLLIELVPQANKVGYLSAPSDTTPAFEDSKSEMLAAGRALGREIVLGEVRNLDFEATFASFVERQITAVIVGNFALFISYPSNRDKILELAMRHRISVMCPNRDFTINGGLMSYEANNTEPIRLAGIYTGRIIKGENPANLPVVQPTKFEFVINLKIAKALGLTIPPTLYALADEIIE